MNIHPFTWKLRRIAFTHLFDRTCGITIQRGNNDFEYWHKVAFGLFRMSDSWLR